MACFLSRFQAESILDAIGSGKNAVKVSLDLGMTVSKASLIGGAAVFPDGQRAESDILGKIRDSPACVMFEGGQALKMQFYLPETGRTYRLIPSGPRTAPTAELAGFRMHRVKGSDPMADTMTKIDAVKPIRGRVLDTCCGLGYTAIAAAGAGADEVYSVEVDAGMRSLREVNPWSSRLFCDRIMLVDGDVTAEVEGFDDGFFDVVIHDPPSLNIAGELYSRRFYLQLHRVLKPGGRLFHYVGAPGSRYRGKKPARGVVERLRETGFADVAEEPRALGVTAKKEA